MHPLLSLVAAVIAGSIPAFACDNCLDPKVHRLCLDSQDYPSCVEEMKGKEESASWEADHPTPAMWS